MMGEGTPISLKLQADLSPIIANGWQGLAQGLGIPANLNGRAPIGGLPVDYARTFLELAREHGKTTEELHQCLVDEKLISAAKLCAPHLPLPRRLEPRAAPLKQAVLWKQPSLTAPPFTGWAKRHCELHSDHMTYVHLLKGGALDEKNIAILPFNTATTAAVTVVDKIPAFEFGPVLGRTFRFKIIEEDRQKAHTEAKAWVDAITGCVRHLLTQTVKDEPDSGELASMEANSSHSDQSRSRTSSGSRPVSDASEPEHIHHHRQMSEPILSHANHTQPLMRASAPDPSTSAGNDRLSPQASWMSDIAPNWDSGTGATSPGTVSPIPQYPTMASSASSSEAVGLRSMSPTPTAHSFCRAKIQEGTKEMFADDKGDWDDVAAKIWRDCCSPGDCESVGIMLDELNAFGVFAHLPRDLNRFNVLWPLEWNDAFVRGFVMMLSTWTNKQVDVLFESFQQPSDSGPAHVLLDTAWQSSLTSKCTRYEDNVRARAASATGKAQITASLPFALQDVSERYFGGKKVAYTVADVHAAVDTLARHAKEICATNDPIRIIFVTPGVLLSWRAAFLEHRPQELRLSPSFTWKDVQAAIEALIKQDDRTHFRLIFILPSLDGFGNSASHTVMSNLKNDKRVRFWVDATLDSRPLEWADVAVYSKRFVSGAGGLVVVQPRKQEKLVFFQTVRIERQPRGLHGVNCRCSPSSRLPGSATRFPWAFRATSGSLMEEPRTRPVERKPHHTAGLLSGTQSAKRAGDLCGFDSRSVLRGYDVLRLVGRRRAVSRSHHPASLQARSQAVDAQHADAFSPAR
eukprot:TRINITY_DN3607_c0_g1_i2.p1 TRINITY_DN3607_c0_g1~~TRINITY_DN3607_c0_g1_i2.p1  ORF type:complete len:801 (+),score=36.91 TRINITY_DN3607_c0_g1_i2:278-2680(+)